MAEAKRDSQPPIIPSTLTDAFQCRAQRPASFNSTDMPDAASYYRFLDEHVQVGVAHKGGKQIVEISMPDAMRLAQKHFTESGCDERTAQELRQLAEWVVDEPALNRQLVVPAASTPTSAVSIFMAKPIENGVPTLDIRQSWLAYKTALENSGAQIVVGDTADDNKDRPNRHWARDYAVTIGGKVYFPDANYVPEDYNKKELYSSRMTADVREMQRQISLMPNGPEMHQLKGVAFEGGQIVVDEKRGIIYAGSSQQRPLREEVAGAFLDQVNATQERKYKLVSVPLYGDAYHLDLALAVLPRGEMIIDPRGILGSTDFVDQLKQDIGADQVITLPRKRQASGLTNLVPLSETSLMMTAASPDLRRELEGRGYAVNEAIAPLDARGNEVDQMMRDGGIRCATQVVSAIKPPSAF